MIRHIAEALTLALILATTTSATTTIDTTPGDSSVFPFGDPITATYGQTITVPVSNHVLSSFTFFLDDAPIYPDVTEFQAHVYAWDGTKAIGQTLFTSSQRSTTNNSGNDGYEEFVFKTNNLDLAPDGSYVLLLSASNFFNGVTGASLLPLRTDNPYTGGKFYYLNNGSDFSAITRDPWVEIISVYDLGFRAVFVPEPSACLLFGCGVITMALLSQSRRLREKNVP